MFSLLRGQSPLSNKGLSLVCPISLLSNYNVSNLENQFCKFFSSFFNLTADIRLGRSRKTMLEMITTKTPIPNTTPIPLADGRGSDAHIFRSLALAVMFFCIDSMDRNCLIR